MFGNVDWSHREAYMLAKHGVSANEADQALTDPERVVIDPDYASKSGTSTRVIGYSPTARDLLTVIVTIEDGIEYGLNGWPSNGKDRRIYATGE